MKRKQKISHCFWCIIKTIEIFVQKLIYWVIGEGPSFWNVDWWIIPCSPYLFMMWQKTVIFFLRVWKYILQVSQRLEYLFSKSAVNNSWKKWFYLLTKWKYLQWFFNSSSLPFWKLHSKNFIYKKKETAKMLKSHYIQKTECFYFTREP